MRSRRPPDRVRQQRNLGDPECLRGAHQINEPVHDEKNGEEEPRDGRTRHFDNSPSVASPIIVAPSCQMPPSVQWTGEVTRCEAPSAFEWTMRDTDADWHGTRVGFTLKDIPGGALVEFYHRGWPAENDHFRGSCYCWASYLRILRRHLEHGDVVPYEARDSA